MSKFDFEKKKKEFNEGNDLMEIILELSYKKTKNLKYKAMLLENKIHTKICNFIKIEKDEEAEEEEEESEIRTENMDEESEDQGNKPLKRGEGQTTPYLTKYEKARVIGARALQISKNSPILISTEIRGDETDPIKIAEMELREGKIPFIIRRYLPDGSYEDWPVRELKLSDN